MSIFRANILLLKIIFQISFIGLANTAIGQPESDRMFKKFSSKEGLLNNSIYWMTRSKYGLWWISTGSGLQRFDGYGFENWNLPADTTATPIISSRHVEEDSHGNVWVFNFGKHMVYPAGSKKYIEVGIDSPRFNLYPNIFPVPVMEYKNRLYAFQGDGIYGFNMNTLKVDTCIGTIHQSARKNELVFPFIGKDETGAAWITQDFEDSSYVFRFKPGEPITKVSLPFNKYGRLKGLIPIGNNQFLFLSTTFTAIYQGTEFTTPLKILSSDNIPGSYVRAFPYVKLKINNPGNILFAGNNGIYEYDSVKQNIQPYATSLYPDINLSRQLMFVLMEDDKGNIWIGRDASDGLLVFYPGKLKFNFLKAPTEYFNLVYTLAVTENGNVIAANFEKGLNIFDAKGDWKKYIPLPAVEHGMSPSIRTMGFMGSSRLIMKSLLGKLFVYDLTKNTIVDITHVIPAKVLEQPNMFDSNLYPVSQSELHFTHHNYLLSVSEKNNQYTVQILDSLETGKITSITYTKENIPVIGTDNGCYIKTKTGWTLLSGSKAYYIKFITLDKTGTIWAASNRGVLKIENRVVTKVYNEASGLLNDFIYGILFDEEGNAWYSCNKGLGCIRKDGSTRFYTEADGLQGDEFDTQSFWKGYDGKLYFGGINGITAFYPREVLYNKEPGQIILTNLQVNGYEYPTEGRIDNITSLRLPYHLNSINFQFTLSDFSEASYNVYKIKLDGLDKTWVAIKNSHSIRYQLTPGSYTFHVVGSNDGNTWSKEFILPVTITPAWWQATWFTISLSIFLISLFAVAAWYYNRIKTARLRQQLLLEHEMQKERERISRDLHDHIGAYSTALIANSESLEQFVDNEKGATALSYLKENAKNILTTLRETIWLLNSNNLTVSGFYEGFINYCTNILRNHEGIEIEFSEDIQENKKLPPATAIHLLRILQEVIQNTVKHAQATKITCYLKCTDELHIKIADNGRGFNQAAKKYGNGIKNIISRADESNFALQIKSAEGMGTEIILTGHP